MKYSWKLKEGTNSTLLYRGIEVEVCNCNCHIKGEIIKHILPCCDLCYKKYLNEDKSLDKEAMADALESYYQFVTSK
ncbi:hypothetical protein [Ralstonia phage RSP15]|uniref:hypothetical protein n=1 Tax=Ralstonia phage RSP15 TaxID=1785960 RepID=UPI00074D2B36|nr:hypothetical protein BH754_gp239 [Ralstonia phage RSP15]BAU40067.1 hypothetical protein [Ralstonia phage RSP15]